MSMWGGRFEGETDALFREFNDSLPVDRRLLRHDIRGSIAWAHALVGAGVLTGDECARMTEALRALEETDPATLEGAEDIHSWVEQALGERVGDLARKLHTGRSRNDQVATDFRLWAREACDRTTSELMNVERALRDLGRRHPEAIMPGYTHLQRAQPVLFAHWVLAYVEMIGRDLSRFAEARERLQTCPLGSAALSGTTFPVDREEIARALGFDRPTANSLDAVSDRDFVLDMLHAATVASIHLSRLAEELIAFASGEFGFVEMSDAVTSGSSLMPQKKNPDAMELVRAKAGRIAGRWTSMAMILKGLPLAYNKDMQEDKPALFEAMDELSLSLRMTARVLDALVLHEDVAAEAARGGYSNATELADYLVEKNVPFRDAHEVAGRIVRRALADRVRIEDLSLDVLRTFHGSIEQDVYDCLTLEAMVRRREIIGGTGPEHVKRALG